MLNMARMYPQQLPMAVLQDKKKASEVKVYEQLKRLSDEYVVFHSTAWLVRSKITLKPEDTEPWIDAPPRKVYPMGEADFIVLHPLMTKVASRANRNTSARSQRRPPKVGWRELEELRPT